MYTNKNLNPKVGNLPHCTSTIFKLAFSATYTLRVNWGEKTKSSFQHNIVLGCYFHLMVSLVGFDR